MPRTEVPSRPQECVPGPVAPGRERATGPADSFEEFFRKQYHRVSRLLAAVIGINLTEAQDIAQEAFLVMFKRWDEFSANPAAGAYLAKVAINLARRYAIKARREALTADFSDLNDTLVSMCDGPAEVDQGQLVLGLLRQLPYAQALTVAYVLDGFITGEISSILHVSPDTVRSNLRHARIKLTPVLQDPLARYR